MRVSDIHARNPTYDLSGLVAVREGPHRCDEDRHRHEEIRQDGPDAPVHAEAHRFGRSRGKHRLHGLRVPRLAGYHRSRSSPRRDIIEGHSRQDVRLPGRGPEGGFLGEGRQLTPGRCGCGHIHHGIQCVPSLIRAIHIHIRQICGAEGAASLVLRVPRTASRGQGDEVQAVSPHRLPPDRQSGR